MIASPLRLNAGNLSHAHRGVPQSQPKLPKLGVLGANVRRQRVARGITQEKFAELAEVNPRIIKNIEAGRINILITTVLRLLRALGCTWEELMRGLTLDSR